MPDSILPRAVLKRLVCIAIGMPLALPAKAIGRIVGRSGRVGDVRGEDVIGTFVRMDAAARVREMQDEHRTMSVPEQGPDREAQQDMGAAGALLARIRVAMRNVDQTTDEPIITTGDLVVDVVHRLVTLAKREISLTPTEYTLLKTLALSAGKVLMHRHLLSEVWGPGYDQDTNLLRVNISKLRHKIEADPARPRYIITEPGVGYRLRMN